MKSLLIGKLRRLGEFGVTLLQQVVSPVCCRTSLCVTQLSVACCSTPTPCAFSYTCSTLPICAVCSISCIGQIDRLHEGDNLAQLYCYCCCCLPPYMPTRLEKKACINQLILFRTGQPASLVPPEIIVFSERRFTRSRIKTCSKRVCSFFFNRGTYCSF